MISIRILGLLGLAGLPTHRHRPADQLRIVAEGILAYPGDLLRIAFLAVAEYRLGLIDRHSRPQLLEVRFADFRIDAGVEPQQIVAAAQEKDSQDDAPGDQQKSAAEHESEQDESASLLFSLLARSGKRFLLPFFKSVTTFLAGVESVGSGGIAVHEHGTAQRAGESRHGELLRGAVAILAEILAGGKQEIGAVIPFPVTLQRLAAIASVVWVCRTVVAKPGKAFPLCEARLTAIRVAGLLQGLVRRERYGNRISPATASV